jgi:hypothetical protein
MFDGAETRTQKVDQRQIVGDIIAKVVQCGELSRR